MDDEIEHRSSQKSRRNGDETKAISSVQDAAGQ